MTHLPQRIIRGLVTRPLRPCIVDDYRRWRAAGLYIAALHLARQIARQSDRPHVGVMLPTSGLFPAALLAGWMLGRTVVPLNYLLKREELEYVIADAGLDLVVTVQPMLDTFGEMPAGVAALKMDDMSFRGLPPLRRSHRPHDDDVAVLLYTSGTSGRPKGVMLTFGNLAANIAQSVEIARFDRSSVLLGVLPQFHSFGFTVLTLLPLTVGCRVVYTARFVPRKVLELAREHRPTAFVAIPSMYNALASSKSAQRDDFADTRYIISGGEPLPEAVAAAFHDVFGRRINEGYGLTETSPVTNICLPDEWRPKSVGRPVPRLEQIIVGADEQTLPPGNDGEVRMRGPNVMKGYYRLPDETAATFDPDGFFRTGDMGRFDEDGHLYITGRIKEMLIIGGENVFPREIEEVLNAHPAVGASAVIGMTDPSRGEVPLAFIELAEGASFDEQALRAHCRQRLAGYKVPREIRVLDALPRNPMGKIVRRELSPETRGVGASSPREQPSAAED